MNRKLALFSLCLACLPFLSLTPVAAQTRTVGVHAGEWFKYGEVSANGTLQAQYQNVESWLMTVTNVSGTNVTVQLVTTFKNETSSSPVSIEGDVVGGNGFENSLLAISANLEAHEATYSSQAFSSYTINETINKAYLHSTRMDFGDVRFTASDGTTLLSYWMQSYTPSVSATFWVKIAGDLSTSQTIYIYYGNSGAATTSSIANTFIFGDDFRLDTTVDASKWVASGSPTTAFDSTNGLTLTRPTGIATLRSVNTYSFFTSKKVITEFRITNAGSWDAGFYVCPTSTTGDPYSQANFVSLCLSDNQAIRYLVKKISGTVNTLRTLSGSTTVFHKNSLMVKTTTTGYMMWVEDGTQQYSNAAETMYNADLNYIYPYVAASGSVSLSLIMKYIALAKYVDPEPSQSAGGSEETPQQTTQTLPATVGLYYWRVTTGDSFGTQGPYSTGRTIFVDRVKITACGIFNNVIDTRIGGSVYYQAVYEADSTAFTGSNGTLSLSSGPMTWSTDRWICTFSYPTSGNQAVFHISSFTETPYGLTTMNNAAGDLVLNWATMTITINKP